MFTINSWYIISSDIFLYHRYNFRFYNFCNHTLFYLFHFWVQEVSPAQMKRANAHRTPVAYSHCCYRHRHRCNRWCCRQGYRCRCSADIHSPRWGDGTARVTRLRPGATSSSTQFESPQSSPGLRLRAGKRVNDTRVYLESRVRRKWHKTQTTSTLHRRSCRRCRN